MVNMRIPPSLKADKAEEIIKEILLNPEINPYNLRVSIDKVSKGDGFNAPKLSEEFVEVLKRGSSHIFKQEPIQIGGAGSIPFINVFAELFPNSNFLLTGVLQIDSNAHAANENLDLEYTRKFTTLISYFIG